MQICVASGLDGIISDVVLWPHSMTSGAYACTGAECYRASCHVNRRRSDAVIAAESGVLAFVRRTADALSCFRAAMSRTTYLRPGAAPRGVRLLPRGGFAVNAELAPSRRVNAAPTADDGSGALSKIQAGWWAGGRGWLAQSSAQADDHAHTLWRSVPEPSWACARCRRAFTGVKFVYA
jgi:hypothetical protein